MPTWLFLLLSWFSLLAFNIVLVIKRVDCNPGASNMDATKDELLSFLIEMHTLLHLHLLHIHMLSPAPFRNAFGGARIKHQMSVLSFLVADWLALGVDIARLGHDKLRTNFTILSQYRLSPNLQTSRSLSQDCLPNMKQTFFT